MKKLKLDQLRVESFATTSGARRMGTVRALDDTALCDLTTPDSVCTCQPQCCTHDGTTCPTTWETD
jgi:hypothetical protein